MSNEWDDAAAGWDDDEAVRSFTAAAHTSLLAVLARADKSLDGAKALDFGRGTGLLTERLAPVCRSIDAEEQSQGQAYPQKNSLSCFPAPGVIGATMPAGDLMPFRCPWVAVTARNFRSDTS